MGGRPGPRLALAFGTARASGGGGREEAEAPRGVKIG